MSAENHIGPLPFGECYFAGKGHPGLSPDEGEILILHVPTGDLWSLSPANGSRNLYLHKKYDAAKNEPASLEAATQTLKDHATILCGGLSPLRGDTSIRSIQWTFQA